MRRQLFAWRKSLVKSTPCHHPSHVAIGYLNLATDSCSEIELYSLSLYFPHVFDLSGDSDINALQVTNLIVFQEFDRGGTKNRSEVESKDRDEQSGQGEVQVLAEVLPQRCILSRQRGETDFLEQFMGS